VAYIASIFRVDELAARNNMHQVARHVCSSDRSVDSTRLLSVISHKTELFIQTVVRTSGPAIVKAACRIYLPHAFPLISFSGVSN
jgi:hypothetical protein